MELTWTSLFTNSIERQNICLLMFCRNKIYNCNCTMCLFLINIAIIHIHAYSIFIILQHLVVMQLFPVSDIIIYIASSVIYYFITLLFYNVYALVPFLSINC